MFRVVDEVAITCVYGFHGARKAGKVSEESRTKGAHRSLVGNDVGRVGGTVTDP